MDFKSRCLIIKQEKKDRESEEEGDDEQSEEPTEVTAEQESASQATEQKTNVDETISSTLTQDFDRDVVKKEFVNLATHYQKILDSFTKLIKEVLHIKKRQLATHIAQTPNLPLMKVTTEEKISSMYGQKYSISESSTLGVGEEFDLKVYGTTDKERIQSVWNTIGDHATLLLLAIGDCVANNRSQAEETKKNNILKSRIQRTMSGKKKKKEHKKGGKQYWQEKKRKTSEEGSVTEKKARWNKPEIVETKTVKTPEPEKTAEEKEPSSDSDKLPDVQLWCHNTKPDSWSFSGPPQSSHWKYIWKSFQNK